MIVRMNIKKSAIWLFAILATVLYSCEKLDNYDAPDGGIYGTILDATTNEPVPLPVQGSSGVIINLFEQDTTATKSIDFYAQHDGTYANTQVFNGDYQVVVNGPFTETAEQTVSINGQTEVNFSVTPFARIEASASNSGKTVTISYSVTATSPEYSVSEVYGYWNFAPGVDNSGSNHAEKVKVNETIGTIVFDLGNSSVYQTNEYKIIDNGNKVYFRVGAKTNGVINYSETIELTL
ncbi:DUF3823 domain-containing protein [Sunxiuqinia sp. A32]|uniref:DUF3823 domain-containing protein n=1 Tax=Sunxiuqinia sp. A32 TaxID=3461496 RepID=UPI00404568CE